MDYLEVEEQIKAGYRLVIAQYRRDDEIEVQSENHRRQAQTLKRICRAFAQPICVLDLGCGTGRYFHCLEKVERLVGLDISEDMLIAARNPVRNELISDFRIELLRSNAYLAEFPPNSFHFVYSLGMFGHGCPVTVDICNRCHDWLVPGGKLLFNVVDTAGLPFWTRARRRIKNFIYPRLTSSLKRRLDERERRSPFFALSRDDLVSIMSGTYFKNFQVISQPCLSPLWNGRHLECLATKSDA